MTSIMKRGQAGCQKKKRKAVGIVVDSKKLSKRPNDRIGPQTFVKYIPSRQVRSYSNRYASNHNLDKLFVWKQLSNMKYLYTLLFIAPFTYPNMATPITLASLLSFYVALLSVSCLVVSGDYVNFSKYVLPQGVFGPESAAFRTVGVLVSEGPYTTTTDGRIFRWQGSNIGFVEFAYTSPHRTRRFCDGNTDPEKSPICGWPMALSFHQATGLLYIADAFYGLLVVGPLGGLATQLASGFKFTPGLDVDLLTGNVYFAVASTTYDIRNISQPGFKGDSTGMLLRYNPFNRQVTVLLTGLAGSSGPAVSSDGRFVLVPELLAKRIQKYWLVGPKANTAEVFLTLDGNPNKVKRAANFGEFWVAVSVGFIPPAPIIVPKGVRFNSNGVALQTVPFATQFYNKTISIVQEQNNKLYVGSRRTNFIGIYSN
ncbi:protein STRICTOSIDINE SYNTHASE-LIKE 12-like [Rutidosis leptorrhynchoides]|uniref:protein STRICTOSIDINE SYNTHASE-LIKE 12-like n=1 Tax=Rutidosis leptorrhynchoides TaxID=125765 RepID=UPI003A990E02